MQHSKSQSIAWFLILGGVFLLLTTSFALADSAFAQDPRPTPTPKSVDSGKSGSLQGPTLQPTSLQPTSLPKEPNEKDPTETPVPTLEPTVAPTPAGAPSRPNQLPATGGVWSIGSLWWFLAVLSFGSMGVGIVLLRRAR